MSTNRFDYNDFKVIYNKMVDASADVNRDPERFQPNYKASVKGALNMAEYILALFKNNNRMYFYTEGKDGVEFRFDKDIFVTFGLVLGLRLIQLEKQDDDLNNNPFIFIEKFQLEYLYKNLAGLLKKYQDNQYCFLYLKKRED